MRKSIVLFLNGQQHEISGEKAGWMLSDYLRYERGLTGTKVVCAEGDCGACTVLRAAPARDDVAPEFLPVNSCIALVAQMDGASLVTVDALAEGNALTPPQRAMVECHGSQCGFCTPGFVMALTGLAEKKCARADASGAAELARINRKEAKNALTGNLCRCTGYEPIIDAAASIDLAGYVPVRSRFWSPEQEAELRSVRSEPVAIESSTFTFYAPTRAADASAFLQANPDARILGSGTDLGVVHNKRRIRVDQALSLHLVPELYETHFPNGRVRVGARVTLTELRDALKTRIPEFARFIDLFASPQIKNAATLVGNVCNASPIADTPPFLLAANATLHLAGPGGNRSVALDDFYLGYRKTALQAGEFVTAIEFDEPAGDESLALYKVSQRKDLDISTVNAAFRAAWNPERTALTEVRVAMGGMAATPLRLKRLEAALMGRPLDESTLKSAVQVFHSEMQPISDLRGSAAFRRVASENLLRRFFQEHLFSADARGRAQAGAQGDTQ